MFTLPNYVCLNDRASRYTFLSRLLALPGTNSLLSIITHQLKCTPSIHPQDYSKEAVAHVQKYLMKNEVPVNLFEVSDRTPNSNPMSTT